MIARFALLLAACTPDTTPRPEAPAPSDPSVPEPSPPPTGGTPPVDTEEEPPAPEVQVDVLTPDVNLTVDLLFVVDSSHSMSCEDQCHASIAENLPANLTPLLDAFAASSFDWHLGVITTDVFDPARSGQLVEGLGAKWIDATTADPQAALTDMIANVGILGAIEERGLDAVQLAVDVEGTGANAGFFRDGSSLHTVVLSNEEDQSAVDAPGFASWYGALRPSERDRTFSSLVCTALSPGEDHCNEDRITIGARYLDASAALGGASWDLLTVDWAAAMAAIGASATEPSPTYFLSASPVVETLQVTVLDPSGDEQAYAADPDGCVAPTAGDWEYSAEENSVTFCALVPALGSTVTLTYEVAGN